MFRETNYSAILEQIRSLCQSAKNSIHWAVKARSTQLSVEFQEEESVPEEVAGWNSGLSRYLQKKQAKN
jgi:hypothetical protein